MKSVEIIVKHEVGLHARPAALFVQTSQKFKSAIKVTYKGKAVNAKSLLGLLSLGVGQYGPITITADGEDETDALDKLTALVDRNFGG